MPLIHIESIDDQRLEIYRDLPKASVRRFPGRFIAEGKLLVGNEGYGLDPELTELCDRRITIKMQHQTDSLNASVASGIFLYHLTRFG